MHPGQRQRTLLVLLRQGKCQDYCCPAEYLQNLLIRTIDPRKKPKCFLRLGFYIYRRSMQNFLVHNLRRFDNF